MTNIADLLGSERVKAVAAAASARQKHTAIMGKVDPAEPALSGYDIDPRSEAMIEVICERPDCDTTILVHPPTGPEPRILLCRACGKEAIENLRAHGRTVQIIRPQVAKRPWRTDDGEQHPITTNIKEKPVYDLDNLSDAELGKIVRERMVLLRADGVIPARTEAKAEQAKAEKAEKKVRKAEQAERQATEPLPEIVVSSSLTVPALDLSEVDLNTAPSSKERSPYNKALYRLHLGEVLDAETTTYGILGELHLTIAQAVAEKAAKKAEPKPVKAEKVAEPDQKVTALMAALDISEKKAKKILATVAQ